MGPIDQSFLFFFHFVSLLLIPPSSTTCATEVQLKKNHIAYIVVPPSELGLSSPTQRSMTEPGWSSPAWPRPKPRTELARPATCQSRGRSSPSRPRLEARARWTSLTRSCPDLDLPRAAWPAAELTRLHHRSHLSVLPCACEGSFQVRQLCPSKNKGRESPHLESISQPLPLNQTLVQGGISHLRRPIAPTKLYLNKLLYGRVDNRYHGHDEKAHIFFGQNLVPSAVPLGLSSLFS